MLSFPGDRRIHFQVLWGRPWKCKGPLSVKELREEVIIAISTIFVWVCLCIYIYIYPPLLLQIHMEIEKP